MNPKTINPLTLPSLPLTDRSQLPSSIQEAVDEAKSEGRIQSEDRSQLRKSDSNQQD